MWKIKILALILLFGVSNFCYSQSKKPVSSRFKYVKIANMEGNVDVTDFKLLGGEIKYMQLLQEFEKAFLKIKKGYPDYYRDYSLIDYTSPKQLKVTLVPKSSVASESKKNHDFFDVSLNTKIFKIYYNIKTKEIYGPIETSLGIIE